MKKSYLLILLVAIMLLFTGCDKVADEKQIQADLGTYTYDDLLGANETITAIEIEKRQTEKDRKMDVVWCNISTENGECAYEKGAVLTYTLYDKGGWILDYVTVDDSSQWIISPLVGVTNEMISDSLKDISIVAEGELWAITEDDMKNLSIDAHDTNLEGKRDTVTATLTITDKVEEAAGTIVLNYIFNNSWELDSVSGDDAFTVSTIAGKEISVSDDDLLAVLPGQTVEYGQTTDNSIFFSSDAQTITVNQDEISNFTIESQETTDRGTHQTYMCSATVTKPHATFALTATIPYYYDSVVGWTQAPDYIDIELNCVAVNVEGEWSGTYRDIFDGTVVLNITSADEQGNISGTYSYV